MIIEEENLFHMALRINRTLLDIRRIHYQSLHETQNVCQSIKQSKRFNFVRSRREKIKILLLIVYPIETIVS
jgi:hypothetical protein